MGISSLIDAGININTIRSYAGHADERTTYFNYCFDRAPDTEKKMLLEKALETALLMVDHLSETSLVF